MAHITFSLRDGSLVYLEEDLPSSTVGPQPVGRIQDALVSLEDALIGVRNAARSMVLSIRSAMPEEPDEIEIEFGLKGALEVGGFLVAKATSDAHYRVKMSWKRTSQPA
jgi:hypothetical protein